MLYAKYLVCCIISSYFSILYVHYNHLFMLLGLNKSGQLGPRDHWELGEVQMFPYGLCKKLSNFSIHEHLTFQEIMDLVNLNTSPSNALFLKFLF